MKAIPNSSTESKPEACEASFVCRSALDEIVRKGAQRMLAEAIEAEVEEYLEDHSSQRDEQGRRKVVRNGHMPVRQLLSSAGPLEVARPRVDDRREGERFESAILPPYIRRAPSLENLIPLLYLKGISTNAMSEALEPILGAGAKGLSPANITRLTESWSEEFALWTKRDLSSKHYVYLWADGVHFKVRLDDDRPCVLVVIGSLPDGTKEIVGVLDGERESSLSWKGLLLDLKRRGLAQDPKLAVGDGALGFWHALEEVFPATAQQRCWVHKTANILDKLPKKQQPHAKGMIHEIYLSATLKDAEQAYAAFMELYQAKYPKAVKCLSKDRDQLFAFYNFPAEHWAHLRSTNPIESTFATVRHRHRQTKGSGSRKATLAIVFKLLTAAQSGWRRLNGYRLLDKVVQGVIFKDGIDPEKAAKEEAA
jgi:putative transposase